MPRSLLAFALATGLSLPAAAQFDDPFAETDPLVSELPAGTYRKAPVRLVYAHVTRGFTLFAASGEPAETWDRADGPALAEVPNDRPVVLEVRNANALLYEYGLSALVRQQREAPLSCGGQGRQFLLAGATTLGGALTGSTPDFDATSLGFLLGFDPATVGATIGQRSASPMTAEAVEDAFDAGQQAQRQILALVARLSEARTSAAADLRLAALRGDVEPVGPMLDAVAARLERERTGLSDPARVPLAVAEMSPEAERAFRDLFAAAAALEAGAVSGALDAGFEDEVADLAAGSLDAAQALEDETLALQDLTLTLTRAREGTRQRVLLRPDYNLREVAIEITEDPELDGLRGTRTGTVRAFLEPARSRGFGCAVAVSLAFSPPAPQYGVSFTGVIEDTEEAGLATSPAVLFEIAPPGIGPVLGLVGGVGLGRNFTPDLYAGGSFRLFRPVLLTGGAVWRRVDQLPDGAALGGLLEDTPFIDEAAFEDALERGWEPTFFVGLSIAP